MCLKNPSGKLEVNSKHTHFRCLIVRLHCVRGGGGGTFQLFGQREEWHTEVCFGSDDVTVALCSGSHFLCLEACGSGL